MAQTISFLVGFVPQIACYLHPDFFSPTLRAPQSHSLGPSICIEISHFPFSSNILPSSRPNPRLTKTIFPIYTIPEFM